jgi:hypothetical protein
MRQQVGQVSGCCPAKISLIKQIRGFHDGTLRFL